MQLSELIHVIKVKGADKGIKDLKRVDTAFSKTAKSAKRMSGPNMEQSVRRMSGALNDAANMAWRLSAAFAASGLGLGVVFKQMDNFEQNEVAFETMLGSAEAAQKALSGLQEFARRTPFNFSNVVELSKRLLAFSFTAEELIPTMMDLGNIAAGVGKQKLPQLILALGQVRAAGLLRGQELRQFTEAGVPLLEELAKTTGRMKTEIQDMVRRGEVSYDMVRESIANLSTEGGRFHNLMIKQSKTLGGLFSNFIDYLEIMVVKVGKRGLLKEAKAYVTGIIDVLETNEKSILERTDQVIRSLLKGMSTVVKVVKAAGHVFKGFASVVGGTENAINLLIASFGILLGARMLGMLGNFSMGVWGAVRALLALQGTAFAIPLAIGAAVAAIAILAEDVIAYFQGRKSITGLLVNSFDEVSAKIFGKSDEISEKLRNKAKGWAKAIAAGLQDPEVIDALKKWVDVAIIAGGVAAQIGAAIAKGIIEGMYSYFTGGESEADFVGPKMPTGFWQDMAAGAAGMFGLNPLGNPATESGPSVGLMDELSQGNVLGRMWDDMKSAVGFGPSVTNVNIDTINAPAGDIEGVRQAAIQGGKEGVSQKDSEYRATQRAVSSPVER